MKISIATSKKGFTIVELLIVVVVIAILAAITIVSYNGVTARAKSSKVAGEASMVLKKLELYRTNTGSLPLQANQNWDLSSDVSSSFPETKLPNSMIVVRGQDNTPDGDVTEFDLIASNANASPAGYVFFACVTSGTITGEKIPYADFTTKTLKWIRTGSC